MITIGLMSGTSLDGVDAVAVRFESSRQCEVLGATHIEMPTDFRTQLMQLATGTCETEIEVMGDAGVTLARLYAQAVHTLLKQLHLTAHDIAAIGAHGQTIRHRPERHFTIQLNQPAHLAEYTGIDVIADFRARDVAAGGEGAPLVPAFHQAVFAQATPTAIVNIGGIANVTLLPARDDLQTPILGFDTGPGNMLLDAWCTQHLQQNYDHEGRWARSGQLHVQLLEKALKDPYFDHPIPKSTGREYFSEQWLQTLLNSLPHPVAPADIANTLTELTSRSIADALKHYAADVHQLVVCGGGAFNCFLLERLQVALPHVQIQSSSDFGLDPLSVEGAAFAWLAQAFLNRQPGNLASVTHAKGPRILGALYPH